MTSGSLARRRPPRLCILSDMSEIPSFSSLMSPTSTVYALHTTSLATEVFPRWYVCCALLTPRRLCALPQVAALLNDYPDALIRATNFDNKLTSDALAATPQNNDYADIVALSVRQLFGNIELTAGWDGTTYVQNDIMGFVRGTWFISVEFSNID